ncbi:MAG: DUF5681 domain-containing protein, partial [Bryobacteraceae bacterium]
SERSPKGQWPKGVSGNPSGRPPGSRNKSTLLLEQMLQGRQQELVDKAIELALNGDPAMMRLCLERIYPAPKERPIDLPLPELRDAQSITEAVSCIANGVGQGDITPNEGIALIHIVETQSRLLQAQTAEALRIEAEVQNQEITAQLNRSLQQVLGLPPEPEAPGTDSAAPQEAQS